jgi:uncharacterized protein (DUF1800 family)
VTKVLQHFVMPNPDSAYVNRLAATFRSSRYDVKTLMRNVFTSPEFVSDQSYRALVKSPTEFMVHAIRALTDPQLSSLMLPAAQGMGQVLFDPPDVGGWPNNDSWISSSTALARINFVSSLLAKAKSLPAADQAYRNFLDGVLSSQTADLLNQATDDRSRWQIVLMSPEFQLK